MPVLALADEDLSAADDLASAHDQSSSAHSSDDDDDDDWKDGVKPKRRLAWCGSAVVCIDHT